MTILILAVADRAAAVHGVLPDPADEELPPVRRMGQQAVSAAPGPAPPVPPLRRHREAVPGARPDGLPGPRRDAAPRRTHRPRRRARR